MLRLTITRNSEPFDTVELPAGTHTLGRNSECDVVLPDPEVSSVHARLEVGESEVVVKDMESLNGLYSQRKKVGKAAFTSDVAFDIAGYAFRGRFRPRAKARASLSLAGRPAFARLAPALILAATLGTFATVILSAALVVRQDTRAESLRRGTLLSRSLAEMNAAPLRARQAGQARVTPINGEDGVRYAFVADPSGKVLAPAQAVGKTLDHPKVAQALREGQTTLYDGPDGETVLVSPIRDAQGVLGVAVVSYIAQSGLAGPSLALPALLGLAAALGLGFLGAWALLRAHRAPVALLADRVDQALKTGARTLDLSGLDPSLSGLAQVIERTLSHTGLNAQTPGEKPSAGPAPDQPPRPESALPDGPEPCFLLGLADYQVQAWNAAFGPLAVPGVAPPLHLLRVLADPAHLGAVLGLLESDEPGSHPLETPFEAVEKGPADDQGRVRILFRRCGDG